MSDEVISPTLDFVAGTIAGIMSVVVGQPFDVVKVKLQCAAGPSNDQQRLGGRGLGPLQNLTNRTRTAGTAMSAFLQVLKEDKAKGLFKGVTSPMLGVAAINASVFTSYKYTLNLMVGPDGAKVGPNLWQICAAGAASGVFTSFITTPIERLKILQQSSRPGQPVPSLASLVRQHSVPSLYRGWTATVLRDLGFGPYFAVYEAVCRFDLGRTGYELDPRREVDKEVREVGKGRILVAGGFAGIAGWGSTFALDVVKTRMQSSEPYLTTASTPKSVSASGTPSAVVIAASTVPNGGTDVVRVAHPYRTTWSTITRSYADGGIRVFFTGIGPTLLRSVPVNMVCFFVFEAVVEALR
ncbi:hypothetical protein ACM66B_003425 [Microbotryomycetes sp. NB124-2]